jgi:uric acid-xanthine permease
VYTAATIMSTSSATKDEPTVVVQPQARRTPLSKYVDHIRQKVGTKHGWFGDYNYAWLCTPSLPFMHHRRIPPPFYSLDSDLPLLVAIACGFQHSLAMLAGLITPPIIFASALSLDAAMSAYMVSASLISCGEFRPFPTCYLVS